MLQPAPAPGGSTEREEEAPEQLGRALDRPLHQNPWCHGVCSALPPVFQSPPPPAAQIPSLKLHVHISHGGSPPTSKSPVATSLEEEGPTGISHTPRALRCCCCLLFPLNRLALPGSLLFCPARSHGEVLAGLKALEKLSRMAGSSEEAQLQLAGRKKPPLRSASPAHTKGGAAPSPSLPTGTILYGGHVLDEGDAQAVESLCRQCLAPASHPLPGSGLQRLLAAVIGHTSPGKKRPCRASPAEGRLARP